MPALTVMLPAKVFKADKLKVPWPALVRPPGPERMPERVIELPLVSKVPSPVSWIGRLLEKPAPAWSVPPPKLKVAVSLPESAQPE